MWGVPGMGLLGVLAVVSGGLVGWGGCIALGRRCWGFSFAGRGGGCSPFSVLLLSTRWGGAGARWFSLVCASCGSGYWGRSCAFSLGLGLTSRSNVSFSPLLEELLSLESLLSERPFGRRREDPRPSSFRETLGDSLPSFELLDLENLDLGERDGREFWRKC